MRASESGGVGTEKTSCPKARTRVRPLTWEYCSPSFLRVKFCPPTLECCLPPSCGFPPKSFPLEREPTISGETFGTRARGRPRTAPPRRRHVMPLAMRPLREENGALLAHVSSALGTHTVAAALKRAMPCERLVSGSTPNQITSCQGTSRSEVFVKSSNVHLFGASPSTMILFRRRFHAPLTQTCTAGI